MSDIHQIVTRQVKQWDADKKRYEEVLKSEQKNIARPSDAKPVVTLSRLRGCRGHELAKLLAHELHYTLFDRKIVDYIAEHMGVRSEVVESLDEHSRSHLELWVKGLLDEKIFDQDAYIRGLSEVVKTSALQGGVVILGRGANFLLAGSSAFHVRVVAPFPYRIRILSEMEGLNEKQARDELKKVDKERQDFIKRYFKRSIDEPESYDLILNMEHTTLDGAVKTILSALRARGWSFESTGGDKRTR